MCKCIVLNNSKYMYVNFNGVGTICFISQPLCLLIVENLYSRSECFPMFVYREEWRCSPCTVCRFHSKRVSFSSASAKGM